MSDREIRDIRDTMEELLEGEKLGELGLLVDIKERWAEIVGEETASEAKPYRLESGRLFVGTRSHASAQNLHFRIEEMRRGMSERLGIEIEDIILRKINLK